MTAKEFIAKYCLVISAERVPENPHNVDAEWAKTSFHWYCRLWAQPADFHGAPNEGKVFSLYYSKGAAHVGYLKRNDKFPCKPEELGKNKEWVRATEKEIRAAAGMVADGRFARVPQPIPAELGEVLECLAMDFQGVENTSTYEEWAGEYGLDEDSRKGEKSYNTSKEQATKFRKVFGHAAYADLLTVQEACSKCGKECNDCQCHAQQAS